MATDTFIIPPISATKEKAPDSGKTKKEKKTGKWAILVGLVILIISLPLGVYYFSQQQQSTDTRSRAAGGTCTKVSQSTSCLSAVCSGTSASSCSSTCCTWTAAANTPTTKPQSACKAPGSSCGTSGDCCNGVCAGGICQGSATAYPTKIATATPKPTTKPTTGGGTSGSSTGGGATATNSFAGCGYIEKQPLSGLKPCDASTYGGNCGVYTYDCGQWCFDKACGGSGCQAIAAKEAAEAAAATTTVAATATPGPTATVTATPEPTAGPTSAPNSSQCDASCQSDSNCVSGLSCASVNGINRCRKSDCPAESGCSCPSTAQPTATTAPVVATTANNNVSGQAMPVSGTGPGLIGSLTVIGSVLLLIAGLVL